ncbi:hypothetical protein E2C01_074546 [Portunus trituberculatus]|uniref:Uncharacterized protein n=1 Tax=Portunus trituberculatus TaxID=210409 RepID=A0A5B7ICR1_PORTR|nr:hypothetical protein [Portunus trituberculatus]
MPTAGAMTLMFTGVILFAFILFVTCFKRQVGRMKKRSRRDPHVPGSEAKKVSSVEVILSLCVLYITFTVQLLSLLCLRCVVHLY